MNMLHNSVLNKTEMVQKTARTQHLILRRNKYSLPQWGKVSAKPTDEVFFIITEYYATFM